MLSRYCCCLSWKGVDISSTLMNFQGRHVFLLPIFSSTWFAYRPKSLQCSSLLLKLVPKLRCSSVLLYCFVHRVIVLVLRLVSLPFEDIRSSCLGLVHRPIVKMAAKSSRVYHTSSRLVWIWLLTQPIHWPPSATAADRVLHPEYAFKSSWWYLWKKC